MSREYTYTFTHEERFEVRIVLEKQRKFHLRGLKKCRSYDKPDAGLARDIKWHRVSLDTIRGLEMKMFGLDYRVEQPKPQPRKSQPRPRVSCFHCDWTGTVEAGHVHGKTTGHLVK